MCAFYNVFGFARDCFDCRWSGGADGLKEEFLCGLKHI